VSNSSGHMSVREKLSRLLRQGHGKQPEAKHTLNGYSSAALAAWAGTAAAFAAAIAGSSKADISPKDSRLVLVVSNRAVEVRIDAEEQP